MTRSKRVRLVTRIVTVPRSESRRRKVRASRLTDTTVPSNSAAEAAGAGAVRVATAMAVAQSSLFMAVDIDVGAGNGRQVAGKASIKG